MEFRTNQEIQNVLSKGLENTQKLLHGIDNNPRLSLEELFQVKQFRDSYNKLNSEYNRLWTEIRQNKQQSQLNDDFQNLINLVEPLRSDIQSFHERLDTGK